MRSVYHEIPKKPNENSQKWRVNTRVAFRLHSNTVVFELSIWPNLPKCLAQELAGDHQGPYLFVPCSVVACVLRPGRT